MLLYIWVRFAKIHLQKKHLGKYALTNYLAEKDYKKKRRKRNIVIFSIQHAVLIFCCEKVFEEI